MAGWGVAVVGYFRAVSANSPDGVCCQVLHCSLFPNLAGCLSQCSSKPCRPRGCNHAWTHLCCHRLLHPPDHAVHRV